MAIDCYNCTHQSKRVECSNHGSLITYIENNYEVDLVVSIKGTGNNKDVIVGNIYKPLKDNNDSEIRIASDCNMNLINLDVREVFSIFCCSMIANSFFPGTTSPARLDKNPCTLIENIYIKLSPFLLMRIRELYSVGYQTISHISSV